MRQAHESKRTDQEVLDRGYLLVEVNWQIGGQSGIGTRQRVPCGDKEAANWELPGGASSRKMRGAADGGAQL